MPVPTSGFLSRRRNPTVDISLIAYIREHMLLVSVGNYADLISTGKYYHEMHENDARGSA